jgi:ATP-binding cassette subfamily F protein 3
MILLNNISLAFGQRKLFDNLNLALQNDDKVGLLGKNGAGKSTLLKAIAGETHVDGSIRISKDTRVAYMPQDIILYSQKTVFDESYSVFDEFLKLEIEMAQLEEKLGSEADDAEEAIEKYCEIQEKLSSFNKADALQRTMEILHGLGFNDESMQQVTNTLSVGWKMRVVLAKLLLQQADFYLFDEPTNHLDLITKEWFLNFLTHSEFGYLLITHDRRFLEQGCDKIFELENGSGTLYYGSYSFYLQQKEERTSVLESAYERQKREIDHKEKIIDRFRGKASKARMAQSMIKKLDKMERIEIPPKPPQIRVSFPPIAQAGKVVLTVENVAHSFGQKLLFKNASCEIKRGSKVALIAPNGCGKTTLFNIIVGKLPLNTGTINTGYNVTTALFEQDQTQVLCPTNSIFQEIQTNCSTVADGTIRGFLASFLFGGDDAFKPISVLSGGEKNRVAMVKTLLQGANFLILDEPTNHLDIPSQDALLDALKRYTGTILIVSHDHAFIQSLADHIIELTPQGLISFPGTYQEYLDQKANLAALEAKKQAAPTASKVVPVQEEAPKTDHEALKQIKKLEGAISKKGYDLERVNNSFADLIYGTAEYTKALDKSSALKQEIATLTQEWEKLTGK